MGYAIRTNQMFRPSIRKSRPAVSSKASRCVGGLSKASESKNEVVIAPAMAQAGGNVLLQYAGTGMDLDWQAEQVFRAMLLARKR